jgi:spermidine synthase
MKPWVELESARAPGGTTLSLWQRDREFVIRVDGRELMSSRAHGSEEELGRRGCAPLAATGGAHVLIGGLGMGFTLRAALDSLPKDAVVSVAELVPEVVAWNRGALGAAAAYPLNDPRVHVLERDVSTILVDSKRAFDAILLDVDNGPSPMTAKSNAKLYGAEGLARAARALKKGGTFALWSATTDRSFVRRLEGARFSVRTEHPPARGTTGKTHVLWLATIE